jgi:hypothetical protein
MDDSPRKVLARGSLLVAAIVCVLALAAPAALASFPAGGGWAGSSKHGDITFDVDAHNELVKNFHAGSIHIFHSAGIHHQSDGTYRFDHRGVHFAAHGTFRGNSVSGSYGPINNRENRTTYSARGPVSHRPF